MQIYLFFDKTYLQKPHCVMVENVSSNKTLALLRFFLKHKDLKSKVRRISLNWILLNQWNCILDEPFRVLRGRYQPTQLYLRAPFSWFAQVIARARAFAHASCQGMLFIYLVIYVFICLFICLSIYLFIYLFIYEYCLFLRVILALR